MWIVLVAVVAGRIAVDSCLASAGFDYYTNYCTFDYFVVEMQVD